MNLGITVILRDAFSNVATQMANNYQQNVQRITDLNGQIGHSMYQTWNGVSMMAKGVATMIPAAFSVREAAQFEKKLAAIRTVWEHGNKSLQEQERLIGEIGNQIKDMSVEIGTDPIQTASGLYTILQANITDTAEALHLLELSQKSAIAGLTTTEDASKALISIRNAYSLTAEEMETTSDQIFQALAVGVMNFNEFSESLGKTIGIVRQSGMELPEYFALKATATLSGMSASQTDSGIRQALQELFQPKENYTIDMLEQMKELGALGKDFEFNTEYMRQTGGFHEFLQEVYTAAEKVDELDMMKDKHGMKLTTDKIMGRLFNDMEGLAFVLNVVGDQAEKYDDVLNKINNSEGKLENSFGLIADTLIHKWEKLKAVFTTFVINVGTPLLKMVGFIVDGFTKMVKWANNLIQNVPFLSYVFAGLTLAVGLLFIALGAIIAITGLVSLAMNSLRLTALRTMLAVRLSVAGMMGLFQRILPALFVIGGSMVLVKKAWTENWGGMRDSIMRFWNGTKLVWDGLSQLIKSTKDGIGSMSLETAQALKNAGLFDFVVTVYMWWFRLKKFWDGFKAGLTDVYNTIKNSVKSMFESSNPLLRALGDSIVWVLQQIGLLRPGADTAEQWESVGKAIGKVTGWFLVLWSVAKSIEVLQHVWASFVRILKFVTFPLRLIVRGLLSVWKIGFVVAKAVGDIILGVARFAGIVYRGIQSVIIGIARVLGIVWRAIRPIITVLGWIVRGVALVLGVSTGLAAAIVGVVIGVVAAIILYWDEISAFFVNLWGHIANYAGIAWEWIQGVWSSASSWFSDMWAGVSNFAIATWEFIRGAWIIASAWFNALVIQPIANFFIGMWNDIVNQAQLSWMILTLVWNIASSWFNEWVIQPVAQFFSWMWNGISTGAQTAWTWLQGIWSVVATWFDTWVVQPVAGFFSWLWNGISTGAQNGWNLVQGVWSVVATWFDETVATPLNNLWTGIQDVAVSAAEGMWNGMTEWLGGIGDWFVENVTAPLQNAWEGVTDFFSGVKDTVVQGVDYVREVGRTGEYSVPPQYQPGAQGLATGGYIKPGKEGLAYLHQNELVINSDTYDRLKDFLNRPSDFIPVEHALSQNVNHRTEMYNTMDVEHTYNVRLPFLDRLNGLLDQYPSTSENEPQTDGEDRYVEHSMERLINHKETVRETKETESGTTNQLIVQMQQMMATMQQMANRPVQVTAPVSINGREIARVVSDYDREKDARQY